MFDASNCGGSAWIGAGAAAGSTRNKVGGVSMPSAVAKAKSTVDADAQAALWQRSAELVELEVGF